MKKIFVVVCVMAVTLLSSVNPASAERDTESDDVVCKAYNKNSVGYVVLSPGLAQELFNEDGKICDGLPGLGVDNDGNNIFNFEFVGYCTRAKLPDGESVCSAGNFNTTESDDYFENKQLFAYYGDDSTAKYTRWTVNL